MKHLFIINPIAGKSNRIKLTKQIHSVFASKEYEIAYTTKEKQASEIANQYAVNHSNLCIYACGGDGTLNEVIQGVYQYSHVSVAIIPIGTGNDFIKSIKGYAKNDFLHLENYLNPIFEQCDVLKVDQYVAINTISIGLDVKVANNAKYFKNIPFFKGAMPYYLALLKSMLSPLTNTYEIQINHVCLPKQEYTFIVACNGSYYGGGYYPCPNANINDGLIDICLINKVTRSKIMKLSNKYKKGTHIQKQYQDIVSMNQAKKVQVLTHEIIPVNIDGEIIELKDPTIEILPQQVKLCLPKQ